MPFNREKRSSQAEVQQRDEHGHFVREDKPETPQNPQPSESHQNPVAKFLSDHSHYDKTQDDILDVHIGNPLRRIALLLEEIKKQKVLSISAKISFGIMGVAVAVGIFSIFGVSNVFCSKGMQTQIGVIKVLNVKQIAPSQVPIVGGLIDWFKNIPNIPNLPISLPNRTVLVKEDNTTIQIPYSLNVKLDQYANLPVAATGNYDACNSTLTVNDPQGIETFQK